MISMINRRIFGQPTDLVGLQLPHPAARRRRPDLRLPHRAPLHHRPGADVLPQPRERAGAPRAPPGRQEQLQHAADPPPGADDPVQLLVVPAALRGPGRLRDLRAEPRCSARSTWSTASSGTPTSRAGPRPSCSCRSSTGSRSPCCRCSASTSSAPSTPSARRTATTSPPGSRSEPSPAGHRRPAVRHDVPARPARRAPGDRDGPARAPRAEGVPLRRARPAAAGTGTSETYFAHATDEALLRREEHQLPRVRRGRRPGRRVLGRPADPRAAARPGAAGGLPLGVQHRRRARDPPARPRRSTANLAGPLPWDPARTSRCRRSPTSSAAATSTTSARG